MPVHADYSDEVITLRLVGEYSHDDMREAFYSVLPQQGAVPRGLLIDVRESTSIRTRSTGEVRAMSKWWAARGDLFQRRLAMIAGGTVEYGLTRLAEFEADNEGLTARVFRNEEGARAWIFGENARTSGPSAASI
jgi:hypothetical protein